MGVSGSCAPFGSIRFKAVGSCRTLEKLQLGSSILLGGVGEGHSSACREPRPKEDTVDEMLGLW